VEILTDARKGITMHFWYAFLFISIVCIVALFLVLGGAKLIADYTVVAVSWVNRIFKL